MKPPAFFIDLLITFSQHNLNVTTLKGPVLAFSLFGDVGKRQFVDLDLQVGSSSQNVEFEVWSIEEDTALTWYSEDNYPAHTGIKSSYLTFIIPSQLDDIFKGNCIRLIEQLRHY